MILIQRQCELLGLSRASYYYQTQGESAENLALMRVIDEEFMRHPFYGVERMAAYLDRQGWSVNVKRVRRLMRQMGLDAIYPKPKLSQVHPEPQVYPSLLRDLQIVRPNQVWSTDMTYIRLLHGFLYLVAIMDWFSRYVLSWEVSISLETEFCLVALEHALHQTRPEIFNSDQGCQFTSTAFTERLQSAEIAISMDGRGRVDDNIFVERLWRSVKYEKVYLHDWHHVTEAHQGLAEYFGFL
ncbi:transposase [Candidatus Vecturithrix granuli]|uniref:Transposase n=1 Tax=Vecturithrix granuli TaxID=1499967 RepID=A0A081C923_VECG1|nr:transposase [Candidatus Vecturithrix granuli]